MSVVKTGISFNKNTKRKDGTRMAKTDDSVLESLIEQWDDCFPEWLFVDGVISLEPYSYGLAEADGKPVFYFTNGHGAITTHTRSTREECLKDLCGAMTAELAIYRLSEVC